MSFEGISRKVEKRSDTQEGKLDTFPQADALLLPYEKEHGADTHSIEMIREVFKSYLDTALDNTQNFPAESGVEFPYTHVSLSDLAEKILTVRGIVLPPREAREPSSTKREFVMGGFPMDSTGAGPFEFSEIPLHRLLQALPQALEDLQAGKPITEKVVYTVGYPTNEYGSVPDGVSERVRKDPLGVISDTCVELIRQTLAEDKTTDHDSIALTGVSTGSSVAAETGSKLITQGIASQEKGNGPQLSVTMFSPVGIRQFNESPLRKLQMAGGLVGESAMQARVNPGVEAIAERWQPFMKVMRERLSHKMLPQMSPEQIKAKQLLRFSLAQALLSGSSIPENVKVTEIVGLDDPLIYSKERAEDSRERTKQMRIESGEFGPLQGKLLPRKKENERIVTVPMPHLVPFYRKSEYERFDKLVSSIDKIHA